MSDTGGRPAPGWYMDPTGKPQARHWDGQRWTDQVQDLPPPRAAEPTPAEPVPEPPAPTEQIVQICPLCKSYIALNATVCSACGAHSVPRLGGRAWYRAGAKAPSTLWLLILLMIAVALIYDAANRGW